MKESTRGPTSVLRLCSLYQGRVHAGTLYLYSSKLSTLSTFVKIYLRTLVKNNVNCQHSQLVRDVIDCSKKLSKNFRKTFEKRDQYLTKKFNSVKCKKEVA